MKLPRADQEQVRQQCRRLIAILTQAIGFIALWFPFMFADRKNRSHQEPKKELVADVDV